MPVFHILPWPDPQINTSLFKRRCEPLNRKPLCCYQSFPSLSQSPAQIHLPASSPPPGRSQPSTGCVPISLPSLHPPGTDTLVAEEHTQEPTKRMCLFVLLIRGGYLYTQTSDVCQDQSLSFSSSQTLCELNLLIHFFLPHQHTREKKKRRRRSVCDSRLTPG